MTVNQRLIISDYLTRKRWYFAAGLLIHLIAMTGCWWMGRPILFGIYCGSALILWAGSSGNHRAWSLAGLAVVLLGVWWSTYRLLGTPHPWRAGAMKGLAAGRRM